MIKQYIYWDPLEIVQTISQITVHIQNHAPTSDIYWNNIETRNGYILQSNKVSNIYRVLNQITNQFSVLLKMREAETYF